MAPARQDSNPTVSVGETLGHYRLLKKIGQGGMGEVYRAEDTTLKRQVAIKLLPSSVAGDPSRLERFQREAETIAALNHPNIVTIYSVEQDRGLRFLTMELVEGESLDQALTRGGLPVKRVVELGSALADALGAAHEKGIVHRDLKPANVMLTATGGIKVLDFGLAKATEPAQPSGEGGATELATLTQEGMVVGTAAYMSPEQAQGLAVDGRSDIFSLGCLLYEAATGVRPFDGKSSIDILHQIIHDEVPAVGDRLPGAPLQLQWILRKALAKDPNERYSSARDLLVDLKTLKRDLDSDSGLAASVSAAVPTTPQAAGKRKSTLVAGFAVGLALVATAVSVWILAGRSNPKTAAPSAPLSIQRLTSSGKTIHAAISPDGSVFAYVNTNDSGEQNLHLRQLFKGQSLELVPFQPVGYWGLTFSSDGSEIYYATKSETSPGGSMRRISTLGGNSQAVGNHNVDSQIAVSPDGSRLAWYQSRYPESHQSSLIVADSDGSNGRALVTITRPEYLAPLFFTGPSWSPDGQKLAVTLRSETGGMHRLAVYGAETGELEWTASSTWLWATQTAWLPEGDGILLIASSTRAENPQIFLVPFPTGEPRQITNDLLDYRLLSLTRDGRFLLTVAADSKSTMFRVPRDGSSPPQKISTGDRDGYYGFSFTPDGRIVYPTLNAGFLNLAIMDADGGNASLLTSSRFHEAFPVVTPQGQIVYLARAGGAPVVRTRGNLEVRRMNLDGGDQQVLATTTRRIVTGVDVSGDGEWAFYEDDPDGYPTLWRVPVSGGDPEQITNYPSERVAISPDSSRIAFYYRESPEDPYLWRVGVAPITGGKPELTFDEPSYFARSIVVWSPDGTALLVNTMPDDRSNLWRVPLDGGDPE
ncbi:MAG: protein kinase, partial [Acidobacteriota bacterium]